MSDNVVERLRDWEHVWLEDEDEREGGLYLKAAERIEELEAKLAEAVDVLAGVDNFVRDLSPFADPSYRPATALARACEVYAELTGGKDD